MQRLGYAAKKAGVSPEEMKRLFRGYVMFMAPRVDKLLLVR